MKRKDVLVSLLLVILLSILFIPLASQAPDGLERVAEDRGFSSAESGSPAVPAFFADYRVPGISNESLSAAVSGIIGALAMFCIGLGVAALLKKVNLR